MMEDRRFVVNKLSDNCWLFFGGRETGKTGLASLTSRHHVNTVDFGTQQDFLEYIYKSISINRWFYSGFIFITNNEAVAEFIRKYFYSEPFRNAVNKIYKSGHKVRYGLNDMRGW